MNQTEEGNGSGDTTAFRNQAFCTKGIFCWPDNALLIAFFFFKHQVGLRDGQRHNLLGLMSSPPGSLEEPFFLEAILTRKRAGKWA